MSTKKKDLSPIPPPLSKRLALYLATYKAAQGLKTKDLVAKAGIPSTVMARIVSETVDPRLSTVETIAKGLGVDAAEMLR